MNDQEFWQAAALAAIGAMQGMNMGHESHSGQYSDIAALTADKLLKKYHERFPQPSLEEYA